MIRLPKSIEKLINEFSKLPGIGQKTAHRLAFYLLKRPEVDLQIFSEALANLKKEVFFCAVCRNMSDTEVCAVCADASRDNGIICVVEEPLDAQAIEQTGFRGTYHILGGVISPLDGIGPQQLNIDSLVGRIKGKSIKEVILATNPSLEGEVTSMQLVELIRPLGVKITRLARGLPVGGDIEYSDEVTISRAMEGRKEI